MTEYRQWINSLLDELNIDADIYASYVIGILEDAGGQDDKEIEESIAEILSSALNTEENSSDLSKKLLQKWKEMYVYGGSRDAISKDDGGTDILRIVKESVGDVSIDQSSKPNNQHSLLSLTEKRRVIQYSSYELDDHTEDMRDYHGSNMTPSSIAVLFQNTNSSCVEEAEKLKRSKMKSSHEAKLERDRASRQAQQQKAQERKEKEKKRTQKQERRR